MGKPEPIELDVETGRELINRLIEAGILTHPIVRLVIDAQVGAPLRMYVERYGGEGASRITAGLLVEHKDEERPAQPIVGKLEAACRKALKTIARLTPVQVGGDTLLDQAILDSIDMADKVRAELRMAIKEATDAH